MFRPENVDLSFITAHVSKHFLESESFMELDEFKNKLPELHVCFLAILKHNV